MVTLADALRQTGYAQDGTLATPTPVESPMTKALADHIASIPQKFNENQAHQMSLLKQAFPGNTYESMMTQGDPKAMTELAMQAPFGAMIAYHGTPHNILGKFDISKVGTGEGAQSYGHGMYFAENPAVAKEYADMDTKVAKSLLKINEGDAYKALQDAEKQAEYIKQKMSPSQQTIESNQKTIDYLKNKWLKDQEITGNLYKVDIPDKYIPNMLDWDKPLKDQTNILQTLLSKNSSFTGQTKREIQELADKGANGEELVRLFGKDQKELSDELSKLGIPGIRYLDAGSRPTNIMDTRLEALYQKHNGDVEKAADDFIRTIHDSPKKKAQIRAGIIQDMQNRPTSNFVVFEPSEVQILEKNSKPISRKELIEKQVNKLKD
jgi:hypothetical protein